MSSGHPEGPSTNPDDWKSPYGTGPGQTPGDRPGDQGHGWQEHPYPPSDYRDHPTQGQGYPAYGGQPHHPPAYGEQPYGYHPPRYGYGPAPHRGDEGVRTHAIVALVISVVLALSCYVSLGGIAGAILSGIALGRVDTDPRGARNLLKWTWIGIGINVALLVLGVGAFVVAGMSGVFSR